MNRTRWESEHTNNHDADASLRNALAAEASVLLSRSPQKLESQPLAVRESGDYQVRTGDTLVSIAARSLVYQDKYPDWGSVQDEVNRLVALNKEFYPHLAKNRNKLEPDMLLKIIEKRQPNPEALTPKTLKPFTVGGDREPTSLEGTHVVKPGETITSIAQKALNLRGRKDAAEAVVNAEAIRIIEFNSVFYPELTATSPRVRPGMMLQIHDNTVGPDPRTEWKNWRDAQPGAVTVAGYGDRITVPQGAKVIQRKGSIVEYMPGSRGFVFDGKAIVFGGASITAPGGTVEQFPGARVVLPKNSRARLVQRS